jgi:hypothetical protein
MSEKRTVFAALSQLDACGQRLAQARYYGPTDEGVEAAMDEARDALLFAKYGIPVEPDVPDLFDEE